MVSTIPRESQENAKNGTTINCNMFILLIHVIESFRCDMDMFCKTLEEIPKSIYLAWTAVFAMFQSVAYPLPVAALSQQPNIYCNQ